MTLVLVLLILILFLFFIFFNIVSRASTTSADYRYGEAIRHRGLESYVARNRVDRGLAC